MGITRRSLFRSSLTGVASLASVGLLASCGEDPLAPTTSSGGSGAQNVLKVGVVPGPDIGLLYVAEVLTMFENKGIKLEVSAVQGPQVVTGVVSGQFDVAYAAYAPPILAMATGTDLRIISGLSVYGEAGHNGATLVKKSSGISKWADIAGRKIATASPRSLSALTLQAAIAKDGGDTSKAVEIVPLPQAQVAQALEDAKVDVGDLVEPFASEALTKFSDLSDIGDSKAYVLGVGQPFTGFFTTAAIAESKSAIFTSFREAMAEAVTFGNENPEAVKKAGAQQAGLTEAVALSLPNSSYNTTVSVDGLTPLVTAMVDLKWVESAPDLAKFVG